MSDLDKVAAELHVTTIEIRGWIAQGWLRPRERNGAERELGPVFEPADLARLRLIVELRHELAVEEETMPVVLSLLDQVYGLRRRLSSLARAVRRQPDEVRRAIAAAMRDDL